MIRRANKNVQRLCSGIMAFFMAAGAMPMPKVSANPAIQQSSTTKTASSGEKNENVVHENTKVIEYEDVTADIQSEQPELTYHYGVNILFPDQVRGVPAIYEMDGDVLTSFQPAAAGDYKVKVSLEGKDPFFLTIHIKKKELTVDHVKVKTKVYDATKKAEYVEIPILNGAVEKVQFSYGSPSFATKNVGTSIKVRHATFQLEEKYEDRYIIDQPEETTADIQKRKVSVTAIKVSDKTYDNTTKASYQSMPTASTIQGDEVKLQVPTPSFHDVYAGENKEILFDGDFYLYGEDATNYELETVDTSSVTATIHKAELTFVAQDLKKSYGEENPDGTYQVKGIVKGDETTAVVLEEPEVFCSLGRFVTPGNHKGVVTIKGGKVNDNYEIKYQPGNMKVLASEAQKDIHYSINEPNGENGYFVSSIPFTITPKKSETSNYDKISNSPDGPWLDSLSYTDDVKDGEATFYLMDSSCGAISKVGTEVYRVDHTKPEIENINFEVEHEDVFSRTMNLLTFKKFFQSTVKVTISASDKTSGVESITYTLKDESKEEETKTVKGEKVTFTLDPNFKGHIYATAKDCAGNQSEKIKSSGVIIEDGEQHVKNTNIDLRLNSKTQKKSYYNTDVLLDFGLKNQYAGIYQVTYSLGDQEEKEVVSQSGKEMKSTWEKKGVVLPKEINQNATKVQLSYEDNAGHKSVKTKYFNLDISAPRISVSYDNNDSQNGYFQKDRMAKIVIEERNFSNENTVIEITKDGKKQRVKSNFITDGELLTREDGSQYYRYVMNLKFHEDGDYTFSISTMDKAGNFNESVDYEGEYPTKFTVDQTKPQVRVLFDNHDVKNKKYYKKGRTATIRVVEHNFDQDHIEIATTGEQGTWSHVGDVHTLKVQYQKDGEYDLSVEVYDKAGNSSQVYQTSRFVIDQTTPKIQIVSPEDHSSNTGNVAPEIKMADQNFDDWATSIDGYHNGKNSIQYESQRSEKGIDITYDAIAKIKANDDYYVLMARAEDKAGNVVVKTVRFTVNRYGSVYTLDRATKKLNGTYVKAPEQDVVIHEYNPDALKEKSIRVSKNSNELEINKDARAIHQEKQGWYHYTYTVNPKVFSEEGAYQVFVSSEDAAGNKMSSNEKGKKAELKFGIDKTKPVIDVLNLEDGKEYYSKTKEVKIHVSDNLVLRDVKFEKNGANYAVEEKQGEYCISYKRRVEEQKLTVIATDAAGNEKKVIYNFYLIKKGTMTKKKKIKLAAGMIVVIIAIAIVIAVIWTRKKNSEIDTEQGDTECFDKEN